MNAKKRNGAFAETEPAPRRKYRVVDSTKTDSEAGDLALADWLERLAKAEQRSR